MTEPTEQPVAWGTFHRDGTLLDYSTDKHDAESLACRDHGEYAGPLYASPPDEFERGRQQGIEQERALWELARDGQEMGGWGDLAQAIDHCSESHSREKALFDAEIAALRDTVHFGEGCEKLCFYFWLARADLANAAPEHPPREVKR